MADIYLVGSTITVDDEAGTVTIRGIQGPPDDYPDPINWHSVPRATIEATFPADIVVTPPAAPLEVENTSPPQLPETPQYPVP